MPSVFLLRRCQPSLQKSHAQVQSLAGWWVCGSSEQVREAPAAIEALKPDFIACDLRLLDGHASRLGYALKHGAHQPPLLLLASTADDLQLFEALRAGGHGYAVDGGRGPGLLAGLRHLAAGRAEMSPLLARQTLAAFGLPRSSLQTALSLPAAQDLSPSDHGLLSHADQHLLSLLGMGWLIPEIGQRWLLEASEVEQRVAAIYRQLHGLAPVPDQALGGAVSTKLARAASFS